MPGVCHATFVSMGGLGRGEFGIEVIVALAYQAYCWGLSIDKACAVLSFFQPLKLTLQDPDNATYRHFADRLLEIDAQAKRIKADGRLLDSTRKERVAELDDERLDLCGALGFDEDRDGSEVENDYRRLCNEIMRWMLDQELFVFVTKADADGTNNAAERQLRDKAMARKTGRTSKTPASATRRSLISSVLQSIGKQLEQFTLESVIQEADVGLRLAGVVSRTRFMSEA